MNTSANRPTGATNLTWCRTIVERLVGHGVAHAVVCPGSRSAAMVMALAEAGLAQRFVQADERSAAFFALGLAKRTARPVVVCTTSGSAVANVLPALSEAEAAGIPLVLLSCDRPARLRGKGLPQTTEQVAICEPLVRASLSLGDPGDSPVALDRLITRVDAAAAYLLPGPEAGPIQINVPLLGSASSTEGLDSITLPATSRGTAMPAPALATAPAVELGELGLSERMRGAIVCGPDWDAAISPALLRRLAKATGLPILADAPGSARGLGIPGMLAEGDLLAIHPALPKPDFLIRIGSAPVSHTMQHLAGTVGRVIRIDRRPIAGDFLAASFCDMPRPDTEAIDHLAAQVGVAPPEWRARWEQLAIAIRGRFAPAVTAGGWSELQAVAEALDTGFGLLQVANSLAIRLVNLLCPANDDKRLVFANRGVSGIDGTIGSFLGALAGHDGAGLLVTGDLAAIHDLPALEACLHHRLRGAMLVLNNAGASLFDLLPLQGVPGYEYLVRNTVHLQFGGIAASFGLAYRRCDERRALRAALNEALASDGMTLIEAVLPPKGAKATLPAFFHRVLAA